MNYNEAMEYIHKTSWLGSKPGLSRTQTLLAALGNPEKKLKFIHIAGTNGKGSTSAMMASVLKAEGYKTGLYTSPYIVTFHERMQINGMPISNEELAELTGYVAEFADEMLDPPTEFELITAVAFEYFFRNHCDVVVLETGLGGELDSTNVIERPELAIITTIDFDHMSFLGTTMQEIASAKAGIIKKESTVLFYGENPIAEEVIREKCKKENATLTIPNFNKIVKQEMNLKNLRFDYDRFKGVSIPLVGIYQYKNAALVLAALDLLTIRGRKISDRAIFEGMANVKWQGRFEILMDTPLFISDGGHNTQGVLSAVESFQAQLPNRKAVFILGIMADKDVEAMVKEIVPVASEFITVTPDNPRSMLAEQLKERLLEFGLPVTACASVLDGVQTAVHHAGENGIVFSLGSLYMYREVLASVKQQKQLK